MLSIRRLIIENFGPYKGVQEVSFSSDRGVYIVYGPNGRGKTTLHNAFRYAIYGEVRARSGAKSKLDIANSEARRESGVASFKTILEFESDGDSYRLTRSFNEGAQPTDRLILEKNSVPLTQVEADQAIAAIAPASVSQFFLFDGELLRQYEDLLDPDSDEGMALQAAIERVLGVPIVANALADLRDVLRECERKFADQYAANAKTERMGVALTEAQDIRSELMDAQVGISTRIHRTRDRVLEIEELLKAQEKGQRLMGRLDELRSRSDPLAERESELIEGLRQVTPSLWKGVLSGRISHLVSAVQRKFDDAQLAVFESTAAVRDVAHLRLHSDCPTCEQDVDESLRRLVLARLEPIASTDSRALLESVLQESRESLRVVNDLRMNDAALVVERDKELRNCRLEQRALADDIREVEEQLSAIDEDELRTLSTERDAKLEQLRRDQGHLDDTAGEIGTQSALIDKLLKTLQREAVKLDPIVQAKAALAKELASLFEQSIDVYRNQLRREVEQHASAIFTSLSSEPDYVGLRITERYGLEILDKDGEVVQSRSAGYEHLVALSLIAALQDSAAVRGPVIMDYPFGRLDSENTANVVAALPKMARQVVLLAFDGEFDKVEARRALGANLVAEFSLRRVSTKNTQIEQRTSYDG